jgi:hypothetical protein
MTAKWLLILTLNPLTGQASKYKLCNVFLYSIPPVTPSQVHILLELGCMV